MFNMGNDWCLDAIVDHLASGFEPQTYDGVFFDRVTQVITPRGNEASTERRLCPEAPLSSIWEGCGNVISLDILRAIASDSGPRDHLIALGYAGWSAGQLEQELAEAEAAARELAKQAAQAAAEAPVTLIVRRPDGVEHEAGLLGQARHGIDNHIRVVGVGQKAFEDFRPVRKHGSQSTTE